ncbi:metallophosphoesterase [Kribbella sp. CA-293567]|uniref:metallophosphoesterase n=1 Tax=Kribbella sp. CA-293567 TaxID=3002436 RepID=UPI0022DD1E50|nr:metallophosphoesterase [Kribbella sp. CA-293567]WBQ04011.1 metallophosphoesterase [Kribbella sp. CA-293567]
MKQSRPSDLSEEELGFRIRGPVRWLLPSVLSSIGIKAVLSGIFGAYADKRELQSSLPADHYQHGTEELWFDFVADLGDGFDATYTVASLLAAPELEPVDGLRLPRASLLVMGGDEVYPAASSTAYEDRTKGPYRAALPEPADPPTLFALPGNHDWYDGLTAFLRVFAQQRDVGGWKTEQGRSYFAINLPQRWWLVAVDTQFSGYIDAPQLDYFRNALASMQKGDAVILCTPTPAWVHAGAGGETHEYDTIRFFDREIIRPLGGVTRVMLSGDSHHYARYAERDGSGQRITSGGGGAFLSATHLLPSSLTLPPKVSRVADVNEVATFDNQQTYPEARESKRLARGIYKLPFRNPGFWGLTAALQTVLALLVQFGLAAEPNGIFDLLAAWTPAAFGVALTVVAGVLFSRFGLVRSGWAAAFAGFLHSLAHLALMIAWAAVLFRLSQDAADWITVLVALVVTPVLVGFVDAELVAAYLLIAGKFGFNMNELFAGQSIEDYKGFLRMHINRAGDLTIYPLKVPKVCHAWKADPSGSPETPWLIPDGPTLRAALIEPPIEVPRGTTLPGTDTTAVL